MAKKLHLDINFNQDNTLIGISCHKLDYSLAFQLNDKLRLKLKRIKDLPEYIQKLDVTFYFPLFHFENKDKLLRFNLLSNHNPDRKLFPAYKTTDYFLLVNGVMNAEEKDGLIEKIKKIEHVLIAFEVDFNSIKGMDNFLTDLELHLLETLKA